MKTILIIEDDRNIVRKMEAALEGLGNIVPCSRGEGMMGPMPDLEEVKKLIATADVILLDGDLGYGTSYKGRDLFPLCAGKMVVGISTHYSFGEVNFGMKNQLTFGDSSENQDFRTLVSAQIQ